MQSLQHLWAIVLAAGQGKRLASLTRALHGSAVPKQFAIFSAGKRSLLQAAVERMSALVPPERTIVVVPAAHFELAERQLADFGAISVMAEPQVRGTAPSLLLALAAVLERDHAAQVVVLPAAHVAEQHDVLLEGILRARADLDSAPITLLAVMAKALEADHSWIMSGRPIQPGIRSVAEYLCSPPEHVARQLLEKGALWDTLYNVSEASTLWRVAERHLAAHCKAIRTGLAGGTREALESCYAVLANADFSHRVIGRQLGIAVSDVTHSGFSEIATVENVLHAVPGVTDRCSVPLLTALPEPGFSSRAARPLQSRPAS